jgi:hypothetical protein
MAKGKHSVALFEVIQSSKAQRAGLSLNTPKWWFKNRKGNSAPPPQEAAMIPDPVVDDSAPAPRSPGIDLKVDPDRQRITFHVSYTSAIVTGFAICVVVALAYMIGQHMKQGPAAALAGPSTEQVRSGAPRADVAQITPNTAASQARQHPSGASRPGISGTSVASAQTTRSIDALAAGSRQVSLNYVVIQGYPPEEKDMAVEARDFLNKNGVATTIETNVPGLRRDWYIVIGLKGFEKPSDPSYRAYEQTIRSLSEKFAGNSKFKKFEPLGHKWTGQEKPVTDVQ